MYFLVGSDFSVFNNKSTGYVYSRLQGHVVVFTLNVKIKPIFYRLVSGGFRELCLCPAFTALPCVCCYTEGVSKDCQSPQRP